ncbi:MAG: YggS family pyridoxal phosphate-dependent enzyme [Legionella sp.]|nr:YggS family pyridoxal phosphate-dependent enzyme [Legionella sp.]
MTMTNSIQTIQKLINDTTEYCQRPSGSVRLLAVSKGQNSEAIREAFEAGITEFGENYWQEAQRKMMDLQDLPITWHFIGPLQSNKTADISKKFNWVHSLDREKIARLLSEHRPSHLPPLNVCIQVNLDEEPSKSGIIAKELPKFVTEIAKLPGLKLRGLMAIPEIRHEKNAQYESLLRLSVLFKETNKLLHDKMDTLSMGMSDDMVPAIEAGSTLLRIGRAIFGERRK